MRIVYLIIVVVFVVAILIFGVQNREMVTMSFLSFGLRAPLAVLAGIVYVLGAITGGSSFAPLRKSVRETRSRAAR